MFSKKGLSAVSLLSLIHVFPTQDQNSSPSLYEYWGWVADGGTNYKYLWILVIMGPEKVDETYEWERV